MNWLLLIAADVTADSLRIFIDNFVSDFYFKGKGSVSQKLFYGYAYLVIASIMALMFNVDFSTAPISSIFLILIAGILSSLGGIPYYRALEIENSTSIGIFIQLAPVLYFVLGWFVLGESFSPIQLLAFAIILSGPALVVFSARKRSRNLKLKAVFLALIYVLLYVSSSFIFVKESTSGIHITSAITLLLIGKGLGNLGIIYTHPKWRKRFYHVLYKNKRKLLRPMFINAFMDAVASSCYEIALSTAPAVALASAISDSAEPIVIFFLGILLTVLWPKFGREKLDRKTVIVHLVATILVVTGVVVLQTIG